jgi:PAS domain S-box-containing protein
MNERRRWSAAQRLMAVLGPAVVVLAVGVLGFGAIQRTMEGMEHVARAHQVSVVLQGLLARLIDAETAERGYIVTGEDRYLEPYRGVRDDVDSKVDSLRTLIMDVSQRKRVDRLAPLLHAKLDRVEHNISLRRSAGAGAAEAEVRTGEGRALMRSIRDAVSEIEAEQTEIIARRTEEAEARARLLGLVVLAGALLAVVLAVLTNLLLVRHARAEAALVTEVEEQNAQLHDQTAELEMQTEELQSQAAHLEETMAELEMSTDELQLAHDALEKRTAEHAALLESAGDGIYGIDPEGTCTFINRRAAELLGYEAEEVLGRNIHDLVHHHTAAGSEYPVRNCPIYRSARSGDGVRVADEVLWRRDGTSFPVEYASYPLLEQGRPAGAVVTFLDVSERKRMQEERLALLEREREARERAEESERQFRTMANSIPQLAWMADETGSIFWYNERWYQYTGATPEEMQVLEWQNLHHPRHAERVLKRLRHAFDKGEPWEDTFPLRGRDGAYRWFLSRALPIRDGAERVVRWFGTSTDVTDLRDAERARDRALREACAAREEAESANLAKSEFLAAMSHELRTPLNAITGYVDLMQMGIYGENGAERQQALERVRRNASSLLALIHDVLQYAKIEAGKLVFEIREVQLAELIADLEPIVELQMRSAGLTYSFEASHPALAVLGDPERTRQILLNLLTNAAKFTPSGGNVSISCEARDGWIDIRVRDTGRGIPAAMVQRVFDPFVQVERSRNETSQQGVGLGLAISRDLAEGMGGTIAVTSTLGNGSTFTLSLPSAGRETPDPGRVTADERGSPGHEGRAINA